MMLITTSRKPGQLTRAMARTVADALGAAYLNRGKAGVDAVMAEAEKAGASRVLFIWERQGNPSRLVVFDLEKAARLTQAQKKDDPIAKNLEKAEKNEPDGQGDDESPKADENEPEGDGEQITEETGWLKPEVGIRGAVYHRRPIRHKGAQIKAEDTFGEAVAALLHNQKGPNQIVLSRFGLKIITDSDLVLELKFRA